MKKGIIKKTFGFVISLASISSFYAGIYMISQNETNKLRMEKESLMHEYMLSDDYENHKNAEKADLEQELNSGALTLDDYNKKVSELSSEKQTENLVYEYGNEDLNERLSQLNESILKSAEDSKKNVALMLASGLLAFPSIFYFLNTLEEFDYDKLDADESYSSKMVIV